MRLALEQADIRLLKAPAEYRACLEIQADAWGDDFREFVPVTILKMANRIGGVCAGAFVNGRLMGFVFGLSGVEGERLVHWSHMLAVRSEARDLGLGRRLKELQRDLLKQRGVSRVYWTFDPLVSRNAHFSLRRLGARAALRRGCVSGQYGRAA